MSDDKPGIDDLVRAMSQASARKRAAMLTAPVERPVEKPDELQDIEQSAFARPAPNGEKLARGRSEDGAAVWFLEGRVVRNDDVVEVYTNRSNGWLRGRFRWSASEGVPQLIVNMWDPTGARDADGLAPLIGTLVCALPIASILRWPPS